MMLYPPVAELVEKVGSRYQLVNLVARRARALSLSSEDEAPGRLTIVKKSPEEKKEARVAKPAEQPEEQSQDA